MSKLIGIVGAIIILCSTCAVAAQKIAPDRKTQVQGWALEDSIIEEDYLDVHDVPQKQFTRTILMKREVCEREFEVKMEITSDEEMIFDTLNVALRYPPLFVGRSRSGEPDDNVAMQKLARELLDEAIAQDTGRPFAEQCPSAMGGNGAAFEGFDSAFAVFTNWGEQRRVEMRAAMPPVNEKDDLSNDDGLIPGVALDENVVINDKSEMVDSSSRAAAEAAARAVQEASSDGSEPNH